MLHGLCPHLDTRPCHELGLQGQRKGMDGQIMKEQMAVEKEASVYQH